MSILNDLTGQQFGKLIVLERARNSKSGNARWICKCICEKITTVIGSHLRSGHTTSCGCNKISDKANGHAKERLYRIWTGMHRRCYDRNADNYKWYGGKGIFICEEWHNFLTFREWSLDNGYNDELTIDRIDSYKNYSPDNCRWQTQKKQMNNVSSNNILSYEGREYTQSEFAEEFNLKYHTVVNRLRLGWSLKRIVNTPEAVNANVKS
ncbi:hypothetical protein AWH56_005335 [Anaerobacillus isosaccharinicus]|uniref:Uncharacterized protein n=1 Tax=Anaerobacillus isosaccharinicus TaxID=1532552 RepID=A0A1S2L988_9BACI|nr:hypothetical protein [Anaerobacillus isosaccharinicus]MBA5584551.1 hypothetical protein [Anaerobacillus isosaccharinicus]QOY37065.1 hypothetical protein AWH56_005335 [Anaerobacillus isosaccharinicus]